MLKDIYCFIVYSSKNWTQSITTQATVCTSALYNIMQPFKNNYQNCNLERFGQGNAKGDNTDAEHLYT